MPSGFASAEKIAALRSFAGSSVPHARLRAALIRSAGDLDRAASVLLADGSLGAQDEPIRVVGMSQKKDERQRQTEIEREREQEREREREKERTKEQGKGKRKGEERRMAWREFYLENYALAVSQTGGADKGEINRFIAEKWKSVGSKKREEYTRRVAEKKEQEIRKKEEEEREEREKLEKEQALKRETEERDKEALDIQQDVENQQASANQNTHIEPIERTKHVSRQQPSTEFRLEAPVSIKLNVNDQQNVPLKDPPLPTPSSLFLLNEANPKPEWPKQVCSRLCGGSIMVSGKKVLRSGDRVILEVPPPPKIPKSNKTKTKRSTTAGPARIVRFSKNGREVGRLAPDISHSLAPALQSGLVFAACRVVEAPKISRMFAEVFLEVTVFVAKEAFEGQAEQKEVEGGVEKGRNGVQPADGETGVDARRITVVNMISTLKLCEPPQREDIEFPLPKAAKGQEPGAVSEEGAEAYYRTVAEIDMDDVKSFSPPKHLACTLREYQRAGVGWMVAREKYGSRAVGKDPNAVDFMLNPLWKRKVFPDGRVFFINPTTGGLSLDAPIDKAGGPYGGILADEMGLGKTVQCIACIVHDIEKRESEDVGNCQDDEQKRDSSGSTELKCQASPRVAVVDPVDEIVPVKASREQFEDKDEIVPVPTTETQSLEQGSTDQDVMMNDPEPVQEETSMRITRRRSRRRNVKLVTYAEEECNDEENDSSSQDHSWTEEPGKPGDGGYSEDDFFESPKRKSEPRLPKRRHRRGNDHLAKEVSTAKRRKSMNVGTSAFDKLMSSAKFHGSRNGGTLIVCPMSLVTQWMNELELHVVPNFLRTVTHYGQSRGNAMSVSLQCADVVVTTYGILASECPEDSYDETGNEDGWSQGGPLFQIDWRRVILDEAHTIKTRTTKWARAAFKLRSERRWCVTGTVIHNHVNDVFSLLHFLKLKPWASWAFWNRGIVSNIESKNASAQREAMSLLRDIISSLTLRRRKNTKDTEGRCIVQLPKKTVEIIRLTPSVEESDFYSALHKRSKTQFDTFVKQGRVMNNFASVLELLLRLRQACDHPYLVFAAPGKDSAVLKDKDKMYKQFVGAGSSQFVDGILKEAENGTLQEARECPLCLDAIDDAVAPKECGHPACRACLTECIQRSGKCPVCRTSLNADSIATLPRATRFAVDLKKKWRSSAKIDALLEDLKFIQAKRKRLGEAIGKTVVFSQFTSMLDLVGMALDRASIKTLRIDGSIPQAQRAQVLERFADDNELNPGTANVLLVSLKAGGVGLNLVSAAHAILLDIHWNPQVDQQAQDRVHRHGQTRDVVIKRYIVKGSVEEKLLQVQDRKQDIADGALGVATDEDKKQARLSELKLLFSGQ